MFVDSNLSPLYRVTSRNVNSVSQISYVNLIVGWIWFMFDMNLLKSSVVPVHIMKVISCVSYLPMNRFAWAGAILVPMAVPCICR